MSVAELASAISTTTFTGELCKDASAQFETTAHQIPELCWDVVLEMKCVVTHASGMESPPWLVRAHAVYEDGSIWTHRGFDHLQPLKPLLALSSRSKTLVNILEEVEAQAADDDISVEDWLITFAPDCDSDDTIKLVIAELNATTTDNDATTNDNDTSEPAPEVAPKSTGTDNPDETTGTDDKNSNGGDADTLGTGSEGNDGNDDRIASVTTDEVRSWLTANIGAPMRFSNRSRVWSYMHRRRVENGSISFTPAVEVHASMKPSKNDQPLLLFGGREIQVWGRSYRLIGTFNYRFYSKKKTKPRPPTYALLLDLTAISAAKVVIEKLWMAAQDAAMLADDDKCIVVSGTEHKRIFAYVKWLVRVDVETLTGKCDVGNLHVQDDIRIAAAIMKHLVVATSADDIGGLLIHDIRGIADPDAKALRPLATTKAFTPARTLRKRIPKPIVVDSPEKTPKTKKRRRRVARKKVKTPAPGKKTVAGSDEQDSSSDEEYHETPSPPTKRKKRKSVSYFD